MECQLCRLLFLAPIDMCLETLEKLTGSSDAKSSMELQLEQDNHKLEMEQVIFETFQ